MKCKWLFVLFLACCFNQTSLAMMKRKREKNKDLVFKPVPKKYDTVFAMVLRACANGDLEALKKVEEKCKISRHVLYGYLIARAKDHKNITEHLRNKYGLGSRKIF